MAIAEMIPTMATEIISSVNDIPVIRFTMKKYLSMGVFNYTRVNNQSIYPNSGLKVLNLRNMYKFHGLSLLELLISLTIVGILVSVGGPAFMQYNDERKLKGAVEASYFLMQQARSVAISKGADVTVDFSEGSSWCIGVSDSGDCNCNTTDSCTVDGIELVLDATDYSGVVMESLTFGSSNQTVFDGTRGITSGNSGSTVLSNGSIDAKLIVSNMGRARICIVTGTLGSYSSC